MRNQDWGDRFEQVYDRIYTTCFCMRDIGGVNVERVLYCRRVCGTGEDGLRVESEKFYLWYGELNSSKPGEFRVKVWELPLLMVVRNTRVPA